MSKTWSVLGYPMILCGLVLAACGGVQESADTTGRGSAASPAPASGSLTQTSLRPAVVGPTITFQGERYPKARSRGFVDVDREPLSTFSVDVDTASYVHVRRHLRAGRLPAPDTVRVEEMVNYFDYDYAGPADRQHPFGVETAVLPTPWNPETRLLHVALQGTEVPADERPAANLVFLVDVSGSMEPRDRLGLAKQALAALLGRLRASDRVALVTFAGAAREVLPATPVARRSRIHNAIDGLGAGGGTGGEGGIELAYEVLERNFDPDAINRVILISDGDFNIGRSDPASIRRLIETKRRNGIYLTVLTVGSGNVNDHIAQALAQAGNGQAGHLDSLVEARKVLDDELASNLVPIADDVKIQIEFNPAMVARYRLIGYETRALRSRDFADDRIDAGEVGSGHSVTALYEIELAGTTPGEPLRYRQAASAAPAAARTRELAFVKLRYKRPGETVSRRIQHPVEAAVAVDGLAEAATDLRFAVAVAAFGELLRREVDSRDLSYQTVMELARDGRGPDPLGLRGEFLQLVRQAESLNAVAR